MLPLFSIAEKSCMFEYKLSSVYKLGRDTNTSKLGSYVRFSCIVYKKGIRTYHLNREIIMGWNPIFFLYTILISLIIRESQDP